VRRRGSSRGREADRDRQWVISRAQATFTPLRTFKEYVDTLKVARQLLVADTPARVRLALIVLDGVRITPPYFQLTFLLFHLSTFSTYLPWRVDHSLNCVATAIAAGSLRNRSVGHGIRHVQLASLTVAG